MDREELLNAFGGIDGEKIRRTKSDKIHIPGAPEGKVQRCIRCHARIDANRQWDDSIFTPSFWPIGVPVLNSSHGAGVVTERQAAQFRACGRKANN